MKLRIETGDDNEILRQVSLPVRREEFGKYAALAAAMVKYVKNPDTGSVGVAAPQVWRNVRIVAVSLMSSYDDETYRTVAMFNPEILDRSEVLEADGEGCLSVPWKRGTVLRNKRIRVRYSDERGNSFVRDLEGLSARIVQHEIDHLDGILFTDKVKPGTLADAETEELFETA